jgi:type III restriction enzyme
VNGVRSTDLVLIVSEQSAFDIAPYERFLDQLTLRGGPQQNEALRVAVRYLLGGHYPNLFALAEENWDKSSKIREHHAGDKTAFMRSQQLGSLLAGSIDHATATGKSYIIFGAAMLALASGNVDRVLVLCPSTTIEEGLTNKFTELASDIALMDLLPDSAAVRVPAVVNAYEASVPDGAICVENIHAAYERSASSIRTGFAGAGERTLVINDEAHHIYQTKLTRGGDPKEWANFLLDDSFGFRRVLNVSGTCFIENDYFSDVIHRYSLQDARRDRRIKDIRYWVSDQDFTSEAARWQAVLDNHTDNQSRYTGVKPITIFVTDKVAKAVDIHCAFTAFLAVRSGATEEAAAERTLVVSSAREHKANLPLLRTVDAPGNKVEFIFSVSMLTEGWDVKNVLQIVPHEKRAFDSKLLISQVLGRGLRLLPGYSDARVVVFNHAKWAPEMQLLFDDVWYDDQRVHSTPIDASPHHFDLDLRKTERAIGTAPASAPAGRAAGEALGLKGQAESTTTGRLADMSGQAEEHRYRYAEETVALNDLIADVEAKMMLPEIEAGTWRGGDSSKLRAEIADAMAARHIKGDRITKTNQAIVYDWLQPPVKSGRRSAVTTTHDALVTRSTKELVVQSAARGEIGNDVTIAVRTDNNRAIRIPDHAGDYDLLDTIIADPERKMRAVIMVTDERMWRTPVDVVIVSHGPERAFLGELFGRANACGIDDWVKSPDAGFYGVPFTVPNTTRQATFNPDWFLRIGDWVLVVETKIDGDLAAENRAKLRDAAEWFTGINDKLAAAGSAKRYFFYFLGSSDIAPFFDAICDGSYVDFLGELQHGLATVGK